MSSPLHLKKESELDLRGNADTVPATPPAQARSAATKRRCVSTACVACRKRKSKCDGRSPSCAACASVYHTPCVYDPNSDHRRKGVYKKDLSLLRNRNSTLQTLVQAILTYDEEDVPNLVRAMRTCDNLDDVANACIAREKKLEAAAGEDDDEGALSDTGAAGIELSGKMSELNFDGSLRLVGGTSNLLFMPESLDVEDRDPSWDLSPDADPITRWTNVSKDRSLIIHLLTMYFTWHYPYFTTLSKELFLRDFKYGHPSQYCSSLLVNAVLALGCHFSAWSEAREDPSNSATVGDHFFKEAKRLISENDVLEKGKLCTVQALALMSVREAGCGREGSGWVYSGMSFRMAFDLGLNVDTTGLTHKNESDEHLDAKRITFWGCFLFDKCWSNYLGRQPQIDATNITVPRFDVFPQEEAAIWAPFTDAGFLRNHEQPARTRTVALQISRLCEISGDLLASFYHLPTPDKHISKQEEMKRLSRLHARLETWMKELPVELHVRDGQLPQVLLMHMFYQLLFVHLYRPFLKYTKITSPLPSNVSPRAMCTRAAAMISKILRIYRRSYGLKQICNIAVYIAHSACTIHLLNLPEKSAQRDLVHGISSLEEIAEYWLCSRRTLRIIDGLSRKWQIKLPVEATVILERTYQKYGSWGSWDNIDTKASRADSSQFRHDSHLHSPSLQGIPGPTAPISSGQLQVGETRQDQSVTSTPPPAVQHQAISTSTPPYPVISPPSILSYSPQPGLIVPQGLSSTPFQSNAWTATTSSPLAQPQPIMAPESDLASFVRGVNQIDDSVNTQEWWFKDQNALAYGLDNWEDPINYAFDPGTSRSESSLSPANSQDISSVANEAVAYYPQVDAMSGGPLAIPAFGLDPMMNSHTSL